MSAVEGEADVKLSMVEVRLWPKVELLLPLNPTQGLFRTKPRTHTRLKLLVIFPTPDGSTAVGVDFGLTRCRREFQYASRQRAPFALGS
jgi:hypothetical protein